MVKKSGFKFVDLFAGIGGFHAAATAMGGECVYAVEIDSAAAKIYEQNWAKSALGDITFDANDEVVLVPDHDVLFAGFPCQPFSKSGLQAGMNETRGTLFWNIAKVIEARQPALVVLENVRNIAGPRHRHEWAIIIRTLRQLGYRVSETPSILSPHQIPIELGGRPQVRERVFIVGARTNPDDANAGKSVRPVVSKSTLPWPTPNWDLLAQLPLDVENEEQSLKLTAQETLWINAWDDFVIEFRNHNQGLPIPTFPIWADSWVLESELELDAVIPTWKQNFLKKNSTLYTRNKKWLDVWSKKWGVFGSEFPPSRRKFEWQAQDAGSLWDCVMHFRPSGVRAKKATYVPALVAITQTSIVGPLKRRISVREAARLQGFPDWFSFEGQREAQSYKQLGNGVSIGVVWQILKLTAARDADLLRLQNPSLLKTIQSSTDSPDHFHKS